MKKALYLICMMLFAGLTLGSAQEVTGKWKTVDDETGDAKSIVEVWEKDGQIYGKIIEILNPERKGKLCDKCEGAEKNKPIEGLTIIKGLVKDGNEYRGGTIFDPEKGKKYKAKIWVDEENEDMLNVRGYIAFLYRTQTWYRVK